jgi:hypothetical protein
MDNPALTSSSAPILTNTEPPSIPTPPLTTVVEQPIAPPAPNQPDPAPQDSDVHTKSSSPFSFGTLIAIVGISITTFGLGMGGSLAYFKFFNDSVPLPKTESAGLLLGLTQENEAPEPSPTASPTPEINLKPETIEKPLPGSLIYLKNNQIYTIKADRTSTQQLTNDDTHKQHLALSPDGNWLAYSSKPTIPELTKNPGTGINLLNISTKEVKEIIKPDRLTYSHFLFSPFR